MHFESIWQNIHRIILKRKLNIQNSFQIPERTNAQLYWISGPTAKLCETAKIVAKSLVIRNSWTTWSNASWLQCYEWPGCDSNRTRARKIHQKMFSNWKWAGKWRCFWIWWTSQQQTVSKKNTQRLYGTIQSQKAIIAASYSQSNHIHDDFVLIICLSLFFQFCWVICVCVPQRRHSCLFV